MIVVVALCSVVGARESDTVTVCVTHSSCPDRFGHLLTIEHGLDISEQVEDIKVQKMEFLLVENTEATMYQFDLSRLQGCRDITFRSFQNRALIELQLSRAAVYDMSFNFINTEIKFSAVSYLEFGLGINRIQMDNLSTITNSASIKLVCSEFIVPIPVWKHFSSVAVSQRAVVEDYEGSEVLLKADTLNMSGLLFITQSDTRFEVNGSGSVRITQTGRDEGLAGNCRFKGFSNISIQLRDDNIQNLEFDSQGLTVHLTIRGSKAPLSIRANQLTVNLTGDTYFTGSMIVDDRIVFTRRLADTSAQFAVSVEGMSCSQIDLADANMALSIAKTLTLRLKTQTDTLPIVFGMAESSIATVSCPSVRVEHQMNNVKVRFSKVLISRAFTSFMNDDQLSGLLRRNWTIICGMNPAVLSRHFTVNYTDQQHIHGFGADSSRSILAVERRVSDRNGQVVIKMIRGPSQIPFNMCYGELSDCSGVVEPFAIRNVSAFAHLSDHIWKGIRTIGFSVASNHGGNFVIDLDSLTSDDRGYDVSFMGPQVFDICAVGPIRINVANMNMAVIANWTLTSIRSVTFGEVVLVQSSSSLEFSPLPNAVVDIDFGVLQSISRMPVFQTLILRISATMLIEISSDSWVFGVTEIKYPNVRDLIIRPYSAISIKPVTLTSGATHLKGFSVELVNDLTILVQPGWKEVSDISPKIVLDNRVHTANIYLGEPYLSQQIIFSEPRKAKYTHNYASSMRICVSSILFLCTLVYDSMAQVQSDLLDDTITTMTAIDNWIVYVAPIDDSEVVTISLHNLENKMITINGLGEGTFRIDTSQQMQCTEFSRLYVTNMYLDFTGATLTLGSVVLDSTTWIRRNPASTLRNMVINSLQCLFESIADIRTNLNAIVTVTESLRISGTASIGGSVYMRQQNGAETKLTIITDKAMLIIPSRDNIVVDFFYIHKSDTNENNTVVLIPAGAGSVQCQFSATSDNYPSLTIVNEGTTSLFFSGEFARTESVFRVTCLSPLRCVIEFDQGSSYVPMTLSANCAVYLTMLDSASAPLTVTIPGQIQLSSLLSAEAASSTNFRLSNVVAVSSATGKTEINVAGEAYLEIEELISSDPVQILNALSSSGLTRMTIVNGDIEIIPIVTTYQLFRFNPSEAFYDSMFAQPVRMLSASTSILSPLYVDEVDFLIDSSFGIANSHGTRQNKHVFEIILEDTGEHTMALSLRMKMNPSNLSFNVAIGSSWTQSDAFYNSANLSQIGSMLTEAGYNPVRHVELNVVDASINAITIMPSDTWHLFSQGSEVTLRALNPGCVVTLIWYSTTIASITAENVDVIVQVTQGFVDFKALTFLSSSFRLQLCTLRSVASVLYDRQSKLVGIEDALSNGNATMINVSSILVAHDRWVVDSDIDFPHQHTQLDVTAGKSLTITLDHGITTSERYVNVRFDQQDRSKRTVKFDGNWQLATEIIRFHLNGINLDVTSSTFPVPKASYINPNQMSITYETGPHVRQESSILMSGTSVTLLGSQAVSFDSLNVSGEATMQLPDMDTVVRVHTLTLSEGAIFSIDRLHITSALIVNNECTLVGNLTLGDGATIIARWNTNGIPAIVASIDGHIPQLVLQYNGDPGAIIEVKKDWFLALFNILNGTDDDCGQLSQTTTLVADVPEFGNDPIFEMFCYSHNLGMRFIWSDKATSTLEPTSTPTVDFGAIAAQENFQMVLSISVLSVASFLLVAVTVIYGFMQRRFRVLDLGHEARELYEN